jgi:response regulator of citrate/malate metabolism
MMTTMTSCATPDLVVVDAHPLDYQDLCSLARDRDLAVHLASTAEGARQIEVRPGDLWMVNATLPDSTGLELISMLRFRLRHAAVCLVADAYCPDLERDALADGRVHFLCKPIDAAFCLRQLLRPAAG